ncbi:MAG: hypothetical protein RL189_1081 [Pseudomonadota bacterium]|jgi:hypothetical protein
MNFFQFERQGVFMASVRLTHLWSSVYGITLKIKSESASIDDCRSILSQAIATAHDLGAKRLELRLCTETLHFDSLAHPLQQLGFQRQHDRFEFKRELSKLPNDTGSPLVWKSAEELEYNREQIAAAVERVTEGDPDYDPAELPSDFIEDFVNHPQLTSGPECISLGFLHGQFAALTVAQVDPTSGWSRISYMGVVPALRRKGLGIWVHRRGFALMKRQHGTHYHGGTSAKNEPMVRLFKKHGCDLYRRLQVWRLALNDGGHP